MNGMGRPVKFILFVVSVCCAVSCSHQKRPIARDTTAMDTFLTVSVYDEEIPNEKALAMVDSAIAEIRRVEMMATDYNDTSEVGIINKHAGDDSIMVSSELSSLLETALQYCRSSDGTFDITVEPLVKAWNFLSERPQKPTDKQIQAILQYVGYRKLTIFNRMAFLQQRGMGIDLGAIAKGYAVEKALQKLRSGGVRKAIVDLGGNLGVGWMGTRMLDSTVATIYIRHPRREGRYFGTFKVGNAGISTSGDYQRYFIEDGVRYHHILNPRTGMPARDLVSVTIVASNATDADALSTLIFVLGRERGMDLLRQTNGVEGLLIFEQGDSLAFTGTPKILASFSRTPADD